MPPHDGAAEIRRIVAEAEDVTPEPPRPLIRELPPADPYPIDALGVVLAPAARAIRDRVQAPLAICAQSALGAMNTLFLARRGVQGPHQVIEGPLGIDHLLRMKINIDWDKEGYEGVTESTIKKYNSMIHTQSAVHCMVELAKQNKIDPGKVVSIEAEVFRRRLPKIQARRPGAGRGRWP